MKCKKMPILLLAFAMAFFLFGCHWTIFRYYRPLKKKESTIEFERYRIRYYVGAANLYEEQGTDSFRVYIEIQYPNNIKDTTDIDEINVIKIDSVCIRFADSGSSICPELEKYRPAQYTGFRAQKLLGPTYTFKRIFIPAVYHTIELTFRAEILNDKSRESVASRRFTEILNRIEQRRAF